MSERLGKRNQQIASMLADGEGVKRFYLFAAQNPHLHLRDACQVIIKRSDMGVCFSYEEWNAMGRRIARGSKGVPYYDCDGNKNFVFDEKDTYGSNMYQRASLSMVKFSRGLSALNGTKFEEDKGISYSTILSGISEYLRQGAQGISDHENTKLLTEGIACSLYGRMGMKGHDITLRGLPYALNDNAKLFQQAYELAAVIMNESEIAYEACQRETRIVEDTDEQTVSDEPVELLTESISESQAMPTEQVAKKNDEALYQNYLDAQEKHPNAVVLLRIGDFYEIMGANAQTIAQELDFVLAGRDVGLSERVDMCGFPYHAKDRYLEKILENHSVLLVDNDIEPLYIVSHKFASEQYVEEFEEQHMKLEDDNLENDEQSEDEFSEKDELNDEQSEFSVADENERKEEKSTREKKKGQLIHSRKRKEKIEPSLFDYIDEKEEETREEKLIAWGLTRGSNVEQGKLRIYDKYLSDPTVQDYAEFLKDEYGWGGSSSGGQEIEFNAKGLKIEWRDREQPENSISAKLNWVEVANAVADLIDADNYLTESEKQEYARIVRFREARAAAKTDEELIMVIADQIVEYGTSRTYGEKFQQHPNFLENYEQFFSDHRHQINDELMRHQEVLNAYIPETNFFDEVGVCFRLEYCPRWQKRLERIAKDTERLHKFADGFIRTCAENYSDENRVADKIVWEIKQEEMVLADYLFLKDNRDELIAYINTKTGVESADLSMQRIAITFHKDYIEALARGDIGISTKEHGVLIQVEADELMLEQGENTELSTIGADQSELGGAKKRYKFNLEAIRLADRLHNDKRNPTIEEKRTLAKYVGWGGLASVFDAQNAQWKKEYLELKSTLSPMDYDLAKGSVLNAHYTSKEVIEGIYRALAQFGVQGNNRILEPAMGTGNFFGYMPTNVADGAKLYGVELDNLTGRIAQKLYPQANIQIKGFEETSFPNLHFDLVVSNVPFGGYGVADSDYNRYNFMIHDYFIAKSLDKLKPSGLMAVITSKGTLDKQNLSARKYLAERAELIGAIRLPLTAFKQSANTEVVTDILFFQKRREYIHVDLQNTEWLAVGKTEQGFEVNNYFIQHPEMVLGTFVKEYGLYGAERVTVVPDDRSLADALAVAIEYLPRNIYTNPEKAEEVRHEELTDYTVNPMCLKALSGRLYLRVGDKMVEQTIPQYPKDAYNRISAMISLRDELRNILDIQTAGCDDEFLQAAQRKLNSNYDRFVIRYGFVNSQINNKLFHEDADSALVFACESISEDKQTAVKTDIFSKRTIRPYSAIAHTEDCLEALQICKNERGKVDIEYIEELTNKGYESVITELDSTVFRNPTKIIPQDKYSGFETAEEYLSGKVVRKLEIAREHGIEANIKALEAVQPDPLTAADITVRVGASWVDCKYFKQFLCELLNLPKYYWSGLQIFQNPHDNSWRIDKTQYVKNYAEIYVTEFYGTNRASAFRLYEDLLNLKTTTVYDSIEENGLKKRIINHPETIAAREKQNKIREKFNEWIFADPMRREDLEKTYNRLFNQIKLPSFDGSYLKFPEMNPAIELKPHQKNAVHRILTNGNTLLHHVVGSGKTFTVCAAIMKLRQYGLAKKPLIAVPNHLVQQWSCEFRKLYPNAKLLIATKEDLEKSNRRKFISRIAMGDWDAVIIAQSSFAKISISVERQVAKIKEEIEKIEATIDSQKDMGIGSRGSIKNLERIKKSREVILKKLLLDSQKDDVVSFESTGVDYLFIDEAQNYKNKFLFTKMSNVSGIATAASQRASDLELKVEYINDLHRSDNGVVFATGTPISNSMTEMYTMQSYLSKRTLQETGIHYFDSWAADFGQTLLSLELAPSGQGYKPRTRFSKFVNLPELLTMYRSFADVQTQDMVKLDVPQTIRHIVTLKPSDIVLELAETIAKRAEEISTSNIDPHIDNMLKITSDGKKLALDPRCFDAMLEDEPTNKINACAQNILEIWRDSTESLGTQIVFCDLSTPKKAFDEYVLGQDFDMYNELKYKLMNKGVPEQEIVYIHEANSDIKKQNLYDRVNAGKVRVLIGSTEKCGAGTNVQKRLIALHHLDTPYRPSDLQQREGRIVRQGNMNKTVQIFTYVMERTFDSYSYQILENKQRFIAQIDQGDLTVRVADDIDETTLSYAEIKAITAANPKIKRKMEVDTEVSKYRILEGQYRKNMYALQDRVAKSLPFEINAQKKYLERLREDILRMKANFHPDAFSIDVLGTVYNDRKEGGSALMKALYENRCETPVAEYCGFKISLNPLVLMTMERDITLSGNGKYLMSIGQSESGNMTRLDNFLTDFEGREKKVVEKLERLEHDLGVAIEQLNVPFEHREHLEVLLKEQIELNAELDLNRREEVLIDEGNSTTAEGGEEQYMDLPTKQRTSLKVRRRKNLNSFSLDKILSGNPDTYVFIKNVDCYELLGIRAETYANIHGLKTFTEVVNGEKTFVLSLDDDALNKVVAELDACGQEIKIFEELQEKHEDSFLGNGDFMDSIEIKTMPDYSIDQEKMHAYGYHWDHMLPLNKATAEQLFNNGLEIYRLNQDNTESLVVQDEELKTHHGLFGIEELEWAGHLYQNDPSNQIDVVPHVIEGKALGETREHSEIDQDHPKMQKRYLPIYNQTREYASEYGEISQYRNSMQENIACRDYIEEVLNNNFNGEHLNEDIEKHIIEKYGTARVIYVLANTVQLKFYDGRFAEQNKQRMNAINIKISDDERRSFIVDEHPVLVNAILTRVINKVMENIQEKEYTQMSVNNGATYYIPNDEAESDDQEVVKIGADGNNVSEETSNEKEKGKANLAWKYVLVDMSAAIATYESATLFRMPNGVYDDCVYYIPNKLIKINEKKGAIRINLPETFIITARRKNEAIANLNAGDFITIVKGKRSADYMQYLKPSENIRAAFEETENNLRANIPDEMKARPNWVAVRTRKKGDTDRLSKFLINCHTGKFAESDNPESWTDFESACAYARDNGCVALAYALDGKDEICCIDLDHCFGENGDISRLAVAINAIAKDTFCERSISGKGLHFFGKTKGLDIKTFSKDGQLEFYQKSHFITMTGDMYSGNGKLIDLDNTRVKTMLENKCERRGSWSGIGSGVRGLSYMTDRDIVEKACAAKNGDVFKALYEGQDMQNNHSNTDMSFMNKLAFWCNGEKDQMLRIFATSGLYRPNKSPDYYECTAIKAIKDTENRYQPQLKKDSNLSLGKGNKGKC